MVSMEGAPGAPPILIAAAAGLAATMAAGLVLLGQESRGRRLSARIADRVTPLAPARAPGFSAGERLGLSRLMVAWQRRMARLTGFKPERRDAYPLRWPVLLLLAIVPACVIARLVGLMLGVSLDLLAPLLWVGCSQWLFRVLHGRHADRLYRQFPDVLSMIVRSVRAGIPLGEALRIVARESLQPTARQFARVADQMAIGIRLEEALRETAQRTGVPEYAFFTVALSLQAQTGGSLAETLENLAEVIRKRVALRLRAVALASEARTSAYVLTALPVVAGGGLTLLNYDYVRPLYETTRGNRVLFGAIFLLSFGSLVMRVMIKRSLK